MVGGPIIPFLRSKKGRGTAPKQSVGVVVGSSLSAILQLEKATYREAVVGSSLSAILQLEKATYREAVVGSSLSVILHLNRTTLG